MKLLRFISNTSSKIFGGLNLPKAGSLGNYISLHSILIDNNQPSILKEILSKICFEFKNSTFDALIIGFDKRDPLHRALDGFKSHTLTSNHYLASYCKELEYQSANNDSSELFYLEPSRL
jgi:hypothetical protein